MAPARPNPPLDYSYKLLPVAIDDIARTNPSRIWASLPLDDWDLSQGFEDISFARLAQAVDAVSHAITASFGRSTAFATFAYIGVPDIRYQIVQVAAIKTGYKVLLSSPLNSVNIHVSLMQQTNCVALLSAAGVRVDHILSAYPGTMKHAVIADLDDLLDPEEKQNVPPYPFDKSWEQGKLDPYLILHSSGTTADPRPIEYTNLAYGSAWSLVHLPDINGRRHLYELIFPGNSKRVLIATAPWHVLSAISSLPTSVFGEAVVCPGFRHRATGTTDVRGFLEHANVQQAVLTPWMMEDVARQPDAEHYIRKLEVVLFGGAMLSPSTSKFWATHTHIQNGWGATEAIATGLLESDREDHEYVYFDTVNTGIEFRQSEAEYFDIDACGKRVPLYEIVLTMNEKTAAYAPWHNRQGMTLANTRPPYPEYHIGDLWTPHPDPAKSAFVFKFAGRVDDTFTLSSASNIHPGPVERAIAAHPRVCGVLVVGNQRRQPAALIEVDDYTEQQQQDDDRLAQEIFDAVVQPANEKMPLYAALKRTHIALVPRGGLVRTPIGKIVRRQSEAKYAALIERMYAAFGDEWQGSPRGFSGITATVEIKVEVSESTQA